MLPYALAIFVAALVAFLIGALWYSPLLFAKPWVKAHGYSPEKLEAMKATAGRAYAVSFLCFLIMATVLKGMLAHWGADSVLDGVKLGFHAWLGFAFTIGLTANMYSDKPLATFLIDAGYQLVYLLVMGAILAVWP